MSVDWSSDVAQADWIGPRLAPFLSGQVTSVVPGGFAAYARVLHPASSRDDDRPVRWAEVANRAGLTLGPETCFPEIALLPADNDVPDPMVDVHGPDEGTLAAADTEALVALLRDHTGTPGDCWFCLWDGFGWETSSGSWLVARDDEPSAGARVIDPPPRPPSVPPSVLDGPRVHLPHRGYLLYRGEADAALAFVESDQQTPNLWWPSDRTWCVATEIDLEWTYVGGSHELVEALLADDRIEALRVEPTDSPWLELPDWLGDQIEVAVERVAAGEEGVVRTSLGTITVKLSRSRVFGGGELRTAQARSDGSSHGSGGQRLSRGDLARLPDVVRSSLEFSIADLTR